MKKTFVIFLFFISMSTNLKAQTGYSKSKFYVGNHLYLVEPVTSVGNRVMIKNFNNKLHHSSSVIPPEIRENYLTFVDTGDAEKERLKDVIKTALAIRYISIKDQNLIVQYFIDGKGKIKEVNFLIDKNTKLTPNDLNVIEKVLREEYSFRIKNNQLKDVNFVSFFLPLKL